MKVSRKKRDSITWHAGRSDGAQPITRGRAGHDATGLREPDKSGQTTGAYFCITRTLGAQLPETADEPMPGEANADYDEEMTGGEMDLSYLTFGGE